MKTRYKIAIVFALVALNVFNVWATWPRGVQGALDLVSRVSEWTSGPRHAVVGWASAACDAATAFVAGHQLAVGLALGFILTHILLRLERWGRRERERTERWLGLRP